MQLERQVLLLEDELRRREDLVGEAEGCLAEALQRLRAEPASEGDSQLPGLAQRSGGAKAQALPCT